MIQSKPRKPKTCKAPGCSEKFIPRSMGQQACSIPCSIKIATAKREKAEKRDIRERREKLKTRSEWIADVQRHFNALIRYRDKDKTCICCGLPFIENSFTARMEAGHFLAVSVAPHLRFDLRNCHGQRRSCNVAGETRRSAMRAGVVARIGIDAVREIESMHDPAKWTIEELKALKAFFIAELKELKK